MVRLHSKSFEIDSSHLDDGEVKIRIELTSVESSRRDRSWIAMAPLGCAAVILGIVAGIGQDWVHAAGLGVGAALCFVSIGVDRWRRYLRLSLVVAFALLLSLGIYFRASHWRVERILNLSLLQSQNANQPIGSTAQH
jgi:hypothetical protein